MRSYKIVDQNFWQNSNFRALLTYSPACLNFYMATSWPLKGRQGCTAKARENLNSAKNFGPHFCATSSFSQFWLPKKFPEHQKIVFLFLPTQFPIQLSGHQGSAIYSTTLWNKWLWFDRKLTILAPFSVKVHDPGLWKNFVKQKWLILNF